MKDRRIMAHARDHRPHQVSPCNRCPQPQASGSIFCAAHKNEYAALMASGASPDECAEFCRRTYWPEA